MIIHKSLQKENGKRSPACNKYIPIPYSQSLVQVRIILNTFKLAGSKYLVLQFTISSFVLDPGFHLKSMIFSAINFLVFIHTFCLICILEMEGMLEYLTCHSHLLPQLQFFRQLVYVTSQLVSQNQNTYIFFVKKNNYNYTSLLISPHPQYSHWVNSGGDL